MENTEVLALPLLRSISHMQTKRHSRFAKKTENLSVDGLPPQERYFKEQYGEYNAFSAGDHYSTCGKAPTIV